jgi:phage gp36-like protein
MSEIIEIKELMPIDQNMDVIKMTQISNDYKFDLVDRNITDKKDYEDTVDVVASLNKFYKETESFRKSMVKPLNDKVKEINDFYKKRFGDIPSLVTQTKTKIAHYDMEEKRKEDEKRKKIEAENRKKIEESMEKGEEPVDLVVPVESKKSKKTENGSSANVRYETVIDEIDVKQLPAEFLIPDEKKIMLCVRAGVLVKGVKTKQKPLVSLRK